MSRNKTIVYTKQGNQDESTIVKPSLLSKTSGVINKTKEFISYFKDPSSVGVAVGIGITNLSVRCSQAMSKTLSLVDKKNPFGADVLGNDLVKEGVRAGVTTSFVHLTVFPIGIIQAQVQRGESLGQIISKLNSPDYLRGLFKAFNLKLLMNFSRSSLITNRGLVSCKVHEMVTGEKPVENKPQTVKINVLIITSIIIAAIDTVLTQYYANAYALFLANAENKKTIENWKINDKMQVACQGIGMRGVRSIVQISACIGAKDLLSTVLYKENSNSARATVTSSLISSIAATPLINALDVVYRHQVLDMNFKTLRSPSAKVVAQQLWEKGGIRPFVRGSGWGFLNTVAIVTSTNLVICGLDCLLGKKSQGTRLHASPQALLEQETKPNPSLNGSRYGLFNNRDNLVEYKPTAITTDSDLEPVHSTIKKNSFCAE